MADANELELLVTFAQQYIAGRRAGFIETANDSRDAERLIERLANYKQATPPADAALADELESIALGDSTATKDVLMKAAAALRARAVAQPVFALDRLSEAVSTKCDGWWGRDKETGLQRLFRAGEAIPSDAVPWWNVGGIHGGKKREPKVVNIEIEKIIDDSDAVYSDGLYHVDEYSLKEMLKNAAYMNQPVPEGMAMVPETDAVCAAMDRQYLAGLHAGYGYGVNDDRAGYERAEAARRNDLSILAASQRKEGV